MRFLFRFVSCCRASEFDNPHPGRRKIQSEEETRGLVSEPANVARAVDSSTTTTAAEITSGSGRSRTRKRSRSGTGENWKPTLAAIEEDNVAAAEEKERRREKEKKAVKRKGSVRSRGSLRFSFHCFRRSGNEFGGVFPGFSAAPFMI
ncbi:hypothetical protein LINGRAPRIM_LOCUS2365 [Linum grandiflorum]